MRITTLIENNVLENRDDLTAEFGLSLHVQTGGQQILFDSGTSGAFADNAETLGIDLAEVTASVLSHQHFDHGGGLGRFFESNSSAPVYLRDVAPAHRFFKALVIVRRPIGLDLGLLERFQDRFEFIEGEKEIAPGIFLITDIGRTHDRPKGNRRLFVERDGSLVPDPFDHELLMVIRENDGMVVFTGCSHSGVLNLIEAAVKRFPDVPIKTVIGGFHLIGSPIFNTMAGSRAEIEAIGRKILAYSPTRVYSAHCTGEKGFQVLKGVMGDTLEPFHTGTIIEA